MSDYLKDMFIEVRKQPNKAISEIDDIIGEVFQFIKKNNIISERESQQDMFSGKKTFSQSAIPAPSVSELGWASLNSNDSGAAAKREELEQYLQRIPGNDLRVKLKNVSRLLNDPTYAKSLAGFGDSQGERIANTLSYLVFLKTLTTVITNFNASSAGFNFEAFLAVLLGGSQIPAAGANTIADLTTGKGVPISLKLYNEKTLKAGGSYNDLIGDLSRSPYYMRYVVATKTLEGKDLDRKGDIGVYQYDLTSDNIVEILFRSADGENSQLIRLPQSVIAGERALNFKVPKMPTIDDIEAKFYDILKAKIGNEPWFSELQAELNYKENRILFRKRQAGYENFSVGQGGRSFRPAAGAPLRVFLTKFLEEKQIENVDPSKLFEVLYDAQDKAREAYFKAQQKLSSISSGLGSYASAAESRKFFNDKLSTGEKRKALMLSLGAVRRGNQYELRRNDIYGIERLAGEYRVLAKAQNDVKIGQITIGTESVQNVFNELVDDVNRTVFEIFEELSSLSTNIQGYFAGGLEDDSKADSAITSAKNIGKKTEQTKDIK